MDDHDALDANVVPLEIHRSRNFRTLLEEGREYLGRNGGVLFRALSIYALPIIVFSFLAGYFFLDTGTQIENLYYLKDHLSKNDYSFLVFNTFVFITGLCIMTLVTNSMLVLRNQGELATQESVFAEFKRAFAANFRTYALNFLIIFIFYYALKLATLFLASFSPFDTDGGFDFSPFNYQMNVIFQMIISFLLMPLILYFGFSTLYVSVRDNIGATDALQKVHERSGHQLKKTWMVSLALYLIGLIVMTVIGYVLNLFVAFSTTENFIFFILFFIQKILALSLFVFMNIASVLLYNAAEQTMEESQNVREEIEATDN